MIPVATPEEMAAVDAAAPEPVEVLIGRAGAATARAALRLLGGAYGCRIVVVAGKGNNGNDGRDAARRLTRRGARVTVVPARDAPDPLPPADLVVDAAYGTGFRGEHRPPGLTGRDPRRPDAPPPVLAVDIPSGVDGLTGEVGGRALRATATVTFAALKPGLLLHPGRSLSGDVTVADIGLDVSTARAGLVEPVDVDGWLPRRAPTSHKWDAALLVLAGSPGMTGAGSLVAGAAQRAGAGMVRYLVPGARPGAGDGMPVEAVGVDGTPAEAWDGAVARQLDEAGERLGTLVVGPGLGTGAETLAAVRRVVAGPARDRRLVLDADGLTALGEDAGLLRDRTVPAVLTPHDGEFRRLTGSRPDPDRIGSARELARRTGAVVLLKGATTVVAHPDGRCRLVTAGDQRLATAGTGDVLSGTIGGLLAAGADPFAAAAAGAWVHGRAACLGPATGLVAGDIVAGLPTVLAGGTRPMHSAQPHRGAAGPDPAARSRVHQPELGPRPGGPDDPRSPRLDG